MAEWTVARLLNWSLSWLRDKGSQAPRLEAQLLLAEILKQDQLYLYLHYDQPLQAEELAGYKALLQRRASGEPVAYILGRKSFWTLELKVGPGVLIPRPETETLVEAALAELPPDSGAEVVELGAGSGAVVLSLALERPGLKLSATELKDPGPALENARELGLEGRIEFLAGDLFEPLAGRRFDLVLMNPPYVSLDEYQSLSPEIRDFEPAEALLAGTDGLEVIRRLVAGVPEHLRPGGWLMFEIGATQGRACLALLQGGPFSEAALKPDLAGRDRVALARLRG